MRCQHLKNQELHLLLLGMTDETSSPLRRTRRAGVEKNVYLPGDIEEQSGSQVSRGRGLIEKEDAAE